MIGRDENGEENLQKKTVYRNKKMLKMKLAFSSWNMDILEMVKQLPNKRENSMPIKRGI